VSAVAGAVCALVVGASGLGVPALVSRIPEPAPADPDPGPDPDVDPGIPPEPAKEPYADIARLPGLGWRAALVCALAAGLVGLRLGWSVHLLVLLPLVPICVALSVVDWRTRLLPTRVIAPTYGLVVVAVLVAWVVARDGDDLARAGWGWLVYGGFFFLMWFIYPPGLGYGDVRLAGVLGIALGNLGWGPLLVGIWSGTLLGGLLGLLLVRLGVVDRRDNPFGPYMVAGALVGVLVGDVVLTL
jgi:leader peptidase (prepilin peptidase)/N-methyltransferase